MNKPKLPELHELKLDKALRRIVSKLDEKERKFFEKIVDGFMCFLLIHPPSEKAKELSVEFAAATNDLAYHNEEER